MRYVVVLLLVLPAVFACVVPRDSMIVDRNTTFCSDVYYFDSGIIVSGNNINLDCAGAVLKSWNGEKGVRIEHSSNITVKGCRIVNYAVGLYVRNSSNINLVDNHLLKNRVGTRFVVVEESSTFNHDVSLGAPFEVFESARNVLSLSNKRVEGLFCGDNFCNEDRNAAALNVRPRASPVEMSDWIFAGIGKKKSPEKLYDWIFGSAGWNFFNSN